MDLTRQFEKEYANKEREQKKMVTAMRNEFMKELKKAKTAEEGKAIAAKGEKELNDLIKSQKKELTAFRNELIKQIKKIQK